MPSVRSDGRTTVTVTGIPTGPSVVVRVASDGATSVAVTGAVDGVLYSTAVSRGNTAVLISPTGVLSASVRADGATGVSVGAAVSYVVSARSDGITNAMVIYTPNLFGPDDDYDPGGPIPISTGPPIKAALDLRGSCSLIPPPLVFG